jgi:succinate dehydrogenase / fumarate reductase membrane anchor subunit
MGHRTPLARVRGLGSAKEGTDQFWRQRVTGIANLVLVCWALVVLVKIAGADYDTVQRSLAQPQNAIAFLLLILSGVIHMRIGMQTIIEDYVHSEGSKLVALLANTFFAITVGLTCVFAILKLSFGA